MLVLVVGKQYVIFVDFGVEVLWQVVDEFFGVGSFCCLFDFFVWCVSQVVVGDVVGYVVVEQCDLLGYQGDVVVQVMQVIIFDFNVIKYDFVVIVLIKVWNQVGQG